MESPDILKELKKEYDKVDSKIKEAQAIINENETKRESLSFAMDHIKIAYGVVVVGTSDKKELKEEENLKSKYPPAVLNASVRENYSSGLTWPDKIMFCLNIIKEGFGYEIVDEIKKFEPNLLEETISINVSNFGSKLKQAGVITAEKVGLKSKYKLK